MLATQLKAQSSPSHYSIVFSALCSLQHYLQAILIAIVWLLTQHSLLTTRAAGSRGRSAFVVAMCAVSFQAPLPQLYSGPLPLR